MSVADRHVRAGAAGNPVVGGALGRASLCGRPDREIADAAAIALSLRTLAARRVGVHSLSGVLRAADGGILGRRLQPRSFAQGLSLARALSRRERDLCQKLHRSEPGVYAVRGGAGLSDRGIAAGEADL